MLDITLITFKTWKLWTVLTRTTETNLYDFKSKYKEISVAKNI